MASSTDLVTITLAMLTPAWVKPAVAFNTGGVTETNATDDYTPRTVQEAAGAVGGPNSAVSTDPNYTFASTIKPGNERVPYPTGGAGAAYIDTLVSVECNATLILPPDAMV